METSQRLTVLHSVNTRNHAHVHTHTASSLLLKMLNEFTSSTQKGQWVKDQMLSSDEAFERLPILALFSGATMSGIVIQAQGRAALVNRC